MWLLADISGGEYGALGVTVVSLAGTVGWLARTWVQREIVRGDALADELREAQRSNLSMLTDKAFPALTEAAAAIRESRELVQTLAKESRELAQALAKRDQR